MQLISIKGGTTRVVFLIGSYAFKFPKFWKWKHCLRGLLNNIDERWQYKHGSHEIREKYCPVLFYFPFGIFLVMKRARPLTLLEWSHISPQNYKNCHLDFKIENFGVINGKTILVDYASDKYMCSDCEFNHELDLKRDSCNKETKRS